MTDSSHVPTHIPADVISVMAILNAVFEYAPAALTILCAMVGLCWYGVLFYDRFFGRDRNPPSH